MFFPVAAPLPPPISSKSGEREPSSLRPAWIKSGSAPSAALALNPKTAMDANEAYVALLHGPEAKPAAILCRRYPTASGKAAAGEYFAPGESISKNCFYGSGGQ